MITIQRVQVRFTFCDDTLKSALITSLRLQVLDTGTAEAGKLSYYFHYSLINLLS